MRRPELGAKHTCVACAERFYDLTKLPAVCPKCQTEQPPEKPRPVRPMRSLPDNRRTQRLPDPVIAAEEDAPASAADADIDVDDVEDVIDPDDDDDDDAVIEIEPALDRSVA